MPPSGVVGSNVVFLCLLSFSCRSVFLFFLRRFSVTFIFVLLLFFRTINSVEGVVWRRWMKSEEPALLVVSYCLTPSGWAQLTNAGRNRQSGLQGTRRTCREKLAILLVPQTATASWVVLCALVCLLLSLFHFPLWSFSLLCLQVVVFLFFIFPARYFHVFATSPAGGKGHDSLFLPVFHFFLPFFLLICLLLYLSFLYFIHIHCVCRACRI